MSQIDREMFIEWLSICTNFSRDYWEKQNDRILELNYREYVQGI